MSEPTIQTGTWMEVEGPGKVQHRRCFLADDGVLWLPAVVAASEQEVFMCAAFDGESYMSDQEENGRYFRSDWLSKEFPECRALIQRIKKRISQKV